MRSGRTRSRSANRRWRRRLALRAYRRGDELAFTARMDMGDELVRVGWNWARGAPGPTWALIRSETGEVVGFGGGVEQRRGDWELWCVLAPLAWRDWPSAVQCAREVVRALVKDWKARRMTLFVREGFAGGALVAGRLGFGCYGRSPDQPGYLTFARSHRGWLK